MYPSFKLAINQQAVIPAHVTPVLTGGLLGRFKQPNGGLLGLAAGVMAVMASASLANQVLWRTRLGAGPSLAWAAVGALSIWLTWRYLVHRLHSDSSKSS